MASSKTTESSAKKTTAAKKATPKASTASKAAKPATAARKKTTKAAIITSEERYKMIEVAAYYIAEKNGFGHNHMDHWLEAEQVVNAKLNA